MAWCGSMARISATSQPVRADDVVSPGNLRRLFPLRRDPRYD
jgi:hypothetical protein